MTGSTWTLALLFLTLLTVHPQAADPAVRDPHIRSSDAELLDAMASGARVSPTLRRLIDQLESSDVVVYLMFDRSPSSHTAGHVSLITSVAGRRYLRISIDRRNIGCQRIAILGHELQHAVEIADEAWVTDQEGIASLYRGIGFTSGPHQVDCFDSRLAIATGRIIQREVLARYTDFTNHAR